MHTPCDVPTCRSGTDAGPPPSNNQHTEQTAESRCSQPRPFLTLSMTEALSQSAGCVWRRERLASWGEALFAAQGVKQREGGSQKTLVINKKKRKKISFSNGDERSNRCEEHLEAALSLFEGLEAGRSKAGLESRLWVWSKQLLELFYHLPHRLEVGLPGPPARSGPPGPPVGRVLAEEDVRWRREARSKPDTALAQAEGGAHPGWVEAGGERGQVLLGQGIVEAQDAAEEIQEHADAFDLRGDGAKRLLGPAIHGREGGA